MDRKKPEILSPAGSAESVYAAVAAGADAVYFGGKGFNARIGAENVTDDELPGVIDYCHLRGVKVYITVNTVYKESEIQPMLDFVERAYCAGADALIVSDVGAAVTIAERFPHIPLHASTQMTAHSLGDVLFLESLGFTRTVLSRELSLDELRSISVKANETEVFVHGALCVCYSGRCLMSSFIGGRSGNRGTCAQPCRQFYTLMLKQAPVKTGFLLSPKDLMGIEILDSIVETGVDALKIEGRMKSPEYVFQVTSAYKECLSGKPVNGEVKRRLTQVFNRGGFTEGYFENHSAFSMMSTKTPSNMGAYIGKVISYDDVLQKCRISVEETVNPGDGLTIWARGTKTGGGVSKYAEAGKSVVINITGDVDIQRGDLVYRTYDKALMDELSRGAHTDTRKIAVKGYCRAVAGEPLTVALEYDGLRAEAGGAVVEKSINRPMSSEMLIARLSKTGGTAFTVTFTDYSIGENIFIGVSQINEVRRSASDALAKMITERRRRVSVNAPQVIKNIKSPNANIPTRDKLLTVSVMTGEQLDAAITGGKQKIARIYAESRLLEDDRPVKRCRESGIELYAALPPIMRGNAGTLDIEKIAADGYLVRTYGMLYALTGERSAVNVALDYHFNIANSYALNALSDRRNVTSAALSAELSFEDIRGFADVKSEITIYGKQTLMTTQQCPVGLYASNKSPLKFCGQRGHGKVYHLKDRKGVSFPVITDCDGCYAYILNDRPIFMAGKMRDINNTPVKYLRLSFTDESPGQAAEIIDLFYDAKNDGAVRDYKEMMDSGLTYGHFYSDSQRGK